MPLERKRIKRGGFKRAAKGPKRPVVKRKRVIKPHVLKQRLDAVFSLYIRAKYPKECYTCRATGKTLQNGHFVSRTYLATRWDENNCRPQCVGCNIWGRGKPLDFEERLIQELGAEEVSRIKSRRKELLKLKPEWYQEKIQHYQSLLKEL